MEIKDTLNEIEQAIKSCDAAHWPAMLSWQEELQQKESRSIVENLILCYIELEVRRRRTNVAEETQT